MSPIRSKILAVALAVATAISVPAAIIGGVAVHRADDRATAISADLDRERADRAADFEAIATLEASSDALKAAVDPDPDAGRYLLVGSGRGIPSATEAKRMPASDEWWADYAYHACPAGETVGPEDAEELSLLGVEIYAPGDVLPGLEELDRAGFFLPHIIDTVGVRCVPAAG